MSRFIQGDHNCEQYSSLGRTSAFQDVNIVKVDLDLNVLQIQETVLCAEAQISSMWFLKVAPLDMHTPKSDTLSAFSIGIPELDL